MPNHASATLIGHLGRDPETRATQSGTMITTTSVAVSTGYGNNKKTTWWNLIAFDKTGEAMVNFLKKGDAAMFIGEPALREWKDKDDATRQTLELTVQRMVLLGGKDDQPADTRKTTAPVAKKVSEDAPFDDEIPF
ncbi:single-stranded DNA-binding protein [Rhizobium beringeri]|uniref:single-stranded DNA-binding protein n=1 Tax=Rhizobium beringeri TaxID=3019934 RepID=UPI003CF2F852